MPAKSDRLKIVSIAHDSIVQPESLVFQNSDCCQGKLISFFPLQAAYAENPHPSLSPRERARVRDIRLKKISINGWRNKRMEFIGRTVPFHGALPQIIPKTVNSVRSPPNFIIITRLIQT